MARPKSPRILDDEARLGEPVEDIVVDDASADGAGQVVTALGRARRRPSHLQSLRHRGKGAGVRHGVLAAREEHGRRVDAFGFDVEDFVCMLPDLVRVRVNAWRGRDDLEG